MASLTFYWDKMSQSCRAVAIFLKANGISHSEGRAVQKTGGSVEEVGRVNLLHVVPVIDDGGFILSEGDTILKYLCGRYEVAERWYPADLQLRARIDEFCTWSNMNIHSPAYGIFGQKVLEPRIKNIPVDQEKLRRFQMELERGLDKMEQVFLQHSTYVCGDEITIADLLVICELMQAACAGYNMDAARPKLAEWFLRVKQRLQPHFNEVHAALHEEKTIRCSVYQCSSFDA